MNLDVEEVIKLFPMPTFRKYQKETLVKIVEEFKCGRRAILLDAPTGFGNSGVKVAIARATETSTSTENQAAKAFYITPQLTLIDQLKQDKYIGRHVEVIKGRQNYPCVKDPRATCDIGLCKRVKDCSCQKQIECYYWIQKLKAIESQIALMSFAYFVLEGHNETQFSFGRREKGN